jgi:hypothetical protein
MTDKTYMREAAAAAEDHLPDNHGIILMAIPYEGGDQRLKYVSNLDRADAIKVVKEWLFNQGEKENWMEHIR